VTFASFEVSEKPQLSTGGAARLINDVTSFDATGILAVNFASGPRHVRPFDAIEDTLFFVYGAILRA
jgi:hypothetical protein